MRRKLLAALLHPHCPEPRWSPSRTRRPRSPRQRLLALLTPALLLAGCQERELPTALAPEGAAFDHQENHCVVTSTADDGGATTLRTLIATPACATITFDASVEGILLTSGPLTIDRDLTITDPSAANRRGGRGVVVSGNRASRVFLIDADSVTVTLSGLTIFGGSADNGGGILNDGTLTLTNSTVFFNNADNSGGGIYNSGTLTLTHSTVFGNEADSGGGILNVGTLTLTNSTVSGNTASSRGGGIFNFAGLLALTHSTVAYNSAADGGGIVNLWFGTARLRNTIIANNHSGGNCYGPIDDLGYNLDSGTSCGFSAEDQSLSSTDPLLGPLQHNGGPTATRALLVGSPAIDAIPQGTNGCGTSITTDQRGVTRPQGGACDIGAFEVAPQPQAITFTSTPPTVALVGGSYAVSATASSDLAVSFSSLTPAVCTVSGSTVSLDAAGTCTVAADQAGNTHWLPAPQVTQSFTVYPPVAIDANGSLDRRTGAATLSGTLTCSVPVTVTLNVSLSQVQTKGKTAGSTISGSASTVVSCSGSTPWTAEVIPTSGRFAAGAADATASVMGANPPVQASQTVQLR